MIPRIRLGLTSFDTTLVPTFSREGDVVAIDAVATPESDAGADLHLLLTPEATGPVTSRLQTDWRLALRVPLPRAAMRLAGPAIDRTVASTVQTIMLRTEAAVLASGRD